ncbi:hypothetical protein CHINAEXTREME_19705 [Halobiforma lacisalsi AJ5]|uniref:Blue (type 1) copper domain-containing protein n=1 Tax=Natronobacterium lacisalsi AJ5 TaxID=358396 RepID=M0LV52_NATLA|nr:plastocyanin/azurin family copper-binding protein [Halobiforma lacisalsi]APW99858.1 hypothetical protein CHINAEXTREME_19705 [Halobiforma lacisalsi AJ5]EMA35960.1 hypothetical protein C445_03853 [Halobiforma lacisalsi AJ5]
MGRRYLLVGGLAFTGLAGCLDDTTAEPSNGPQDESDDRTDDDEADGADDGIPEEARAVGKATIEAVAAGNATEAASYAPHEYVVDSGQESWERAYGEFWTPDAVRSIAFRGEARDRIDTLDLFEDGTVDAEHQLEYALELEHEATGQRYDRRARAIVVEIEDEWYAWYQGDSQLFRPRTNAAVQVRTGDLGTAEITLLDRNDAATVFVTDGDDESAFDPGDYRLEEPGETITISAENEGVPAGTYEVVTAVDDPAEPGALVLETVSLVDPSPWTDVTEIELEANVSGWTGSVPDHIEGVENPTLVLEEGREYTFTVVNGDGSVHDFQLWDENEGVVDEYATDFIEDDDETRTLTVTATEELAEYVCEPHQMTMRGDVVLLESFEDE